MKLPKSGAAGFWVPSKLFYDLEYAYAQRPKDLAKLEAKDEEIAELRAALKAMTTTATLSESRADKWQLRSDFLFNENMELRLKIVPEGDPWWIRAIVFVLGVGATLGAVAAARGLVVPLDQSQTQPTAQP